MNAAERNNRLLKLMLVLVRDRRAMQGRIRSVGYLRDYAALPEDLGVHTLSRMNEEEIASLAEQAGIKPAPIGAKSDIYLNDLGYTIQSLANYPPVILAGVPRAGIEQICRRIGVEIDRIDRQAAEYWTLRRAGRLGEEVGNSDPQSPFRAYRELLEPLIGYCLFTGSEHGESRFPADCMLDYTEPLNTNTWVIYEPQEAMDEIWNRLNFRMEGTGESDWTLHVRVAEA